MTTQKNYTIDPDCNDMIKIFKNIKKDQKNSIIWNIEFIDIDRTHYYDDNEPISMKYIQVISKEKDCHCKRKVVIIVCLGGYGRTYCPTCHKEIGWGY